MTAPRCCEGGTRCAKCRQCTLAPVVVAVCQTATGPAGSSVIYCDGCARARWRAHKGACLGCAKHLRGECPAARDMRHVIEAAAARRRAERQADR